MEHRKIKYRPITQWKYELVEDFKIQTRIFPVGIIVHTYFTLDIDGLLSIFKEYMWDGPSGPIVDTKDMMISSLVHDAFYQMFRAKFLIIERWRKTVDELFIQIFIEDAAFVIQRDFTTWYDKAVLNGIRKKAAGIRAWYCLRGLRAFAESVAEPKPDLPESVVLEAP